jgi:CheY-like chemotaxis protein
MDQPRIIRLLIVEDDRAYLHLLKRAFRDRPGQIRWELTIAQDGEQAVSVLFAEEAESAPLPDLVLLDWSLPKVSGSEVLQRLKEHPRLRRIPVLVVSSSEADTDIHAAYDSYANGYITKPGNLDKFAAMVETIERFWITLARLPKAERAIRHQRGGGAG